MTSKCEIKQCRSGKQPTIHVNKDNSDAYWRVCICEDCANVLSVNEGDDIPEGANELLKAYYDLTHGPA